MTESLVPEPNAQITFGEFQSVDMRVAKIKSADRVDGLHNPSRLLKLDLGTLGDRQSVAQLALVDDKDLIGKNVIVCINLGQKKIGPYFSDVLVLGVPHLESPKGQAQATPIFVGDDAVLGSRVF